MKKLLMITPHLSTGGQPQYLLRQIESYVGEYEIHCIEYSNITGGVFVVQRDKILGIIGDRLITLGDDKSTIVNIINQINPDIIHFQEIPETFVEAGLLDIIYRADREYFIVVTTHSSHTDPGSIKYTADKFVLVSEWSRKSFLKIFDAKICDVWEYPVVEQKYDKLQYKKELGFDPSYRHVLHVGLFTPGKNQKAIIDMAKMCLDRKIVFHFVGNQAENFRDYWGPLMESLPENCVWHNERSDVDKFYMASDLFYFPSLFELNPISVKEAIGYGLPVFINKLHTYEDVYDGVANYIEEDIAKNLERVLEVLNPAKEISGWFSYSDLYDRFIDESVDGSRIVEIGCWLGKSTDYLIDKIKRSGKEIYLDVIDTFKGSSGQEYKSVLEKFDNDIYQSFCDNVSEYGKMSVIKNSSHDSASLYQNGSIDFLMIDGDQSYEGVDSDIRDFYYKVRPGGIISGDDCGFRYDGDVTKTAVGEFFLGCQIHSKSNYNWWYRIPRIQVIHVSTTPIQNRAEKSIKNISMLEKYGMHIKYIQNPPYVGEVNLETYKDKGNLHNVKPSHYGCFLGHTQALSEIDAENYDYTIILEEDAYIHTDLREFADAVHKSIFCCEKDSNVRYVSFGADIMAERKEYNHLFDDAWHQILAHCYMIPNRHKEWYMEQIRLGYWDSADLWYNHIFHDDRKTRLVSKKTYSKQLNGVSIIDGVYKDYTNGNY